MTAKERIAFLRGIRQERKAWHSAFVRLMSSPEHSRADKSARNLVTLRRMDYDDERRVNCWPSDYAVNEVLELEAQQRLSQSAPPPAEEASP